MTKNIYKQWIKRSVENARKTRSLNLEKSNNENKIQWIPGHFSDSCKKFKTKSSKSLSSFLKWLPSYINERISPNDIVFQKLQVEKSSLVIVSFVSKRLFDFKNRFRFYSQITDDFLWKFSGENEFVENIKNDFYFVCSYILEPIF